MTNRQVSTPAAGVAQERSTTNVADPPTLKWKTRSEGHVNAGKMVVFFCGFATGCVVLATAIQYFV